MTGSPGVDFLTPVGRLVQGSVWTLNDTDRQGKPLVTTEGKPKKECFFSVAYNKSDPAVMAEFETLFALMRQTAMQGWPQHFNAQGQCTVPKFSWKWQDGDGIDGDGKDNKLKQGFAGHHILTFKSSILPRAFRSGMYARNQQLRNEDDIRPGFFIRVSGTMRPNIGSRVPGLYLNSDMVELIAGGEPIVQGRDASEVFAGRQVASLPAGAIALGTAIDVRASGLPTTGVPQSMQSAGFAMAPQGLPGAPITPNAGFVAGAITPGSALPAGPGAGLPMGPGALAPAPVPRLVLTSAAGAYTYEQYIQAGHTNETLIANGLAIWQ